MLVPYPHQIEGADFLAPKPVALIADSPRVGKNLAAILAADRVGAIRILIITTVSGRAVLRRDFEQNQTIRRRVQVMNGRDQLTGDVIVVSWAGVNNPTLHAKLLSRRWDLILVDESHMAKNFDAKRSQALYGVLVNDGRGLHQGRALIVRAERCWLMSGTPLAHDPGDAYPMLRALAPERLLGNPKRGWPDVTRREAFYDRYTIRKPHAISAYSTKLIVTGGRNEDELRARLGGFMIRRTQAQIGIIPLRYSLRPLEISAAQRRDLERDVDRAAVIEAIDSGNMTALQMRVGRILQLTGQLKAHAVVAALHDEFAVGGLDRIVLGFWHISVGRILKEGLTEYGVTGIDGATPFEARGPAIEAFSRPGGPKVFLQQLEAAGEAIDLSASDVMWFVESVFSPRVMHQAAQRIVNLRRSRQPVVQVAFIEDSIDEAVQNALLRLWSAIRKVIS